MRDEDPSLELARIGPLHRKRHPVVLDSLNRLVYLRHHYIQTVLFKGDSDERSD
jgi:hypothetical protein